ncbi:MAG: class I SAM-dependent methyltransferase [Chloroflexi bacterium]|nr:MAG: class I SAM-dependent methyltransferase [Chloroflexota bacterium]
MRCRHCGAEVTLELVDLGTAPPSNGFLTREALRHPEPWLPLRVLVCERCWLAQTEDFIRPDELFAPDYAYFSSYSSAWLDHAERYVADMVSRFDLGPDSLVVEVAANDGYLLQYVQARGISCLGIEPTASTAAAARERGIEVVEEFFGTSLADELTSGGQQADLLIANNVLAHVPDINDFVRGFTRLLKPSGVATFEFHHLQRLIDGCQFDTMYHEHFSYLSLTAVDRILAAAGLAVFDVAELETHGGSLRVFAQRADGGGQPRMPAVDSLLAAEDAAGMRTRDYYAGFGERVLQVKHGFLAFLLEARASGKAVAGYGAAAKGNTLLNYAGVRHDLVAFVADRNPAKQGRFLPGSRIPVVSEDALRDGQPDFIVIFPWNLRDEIASQLAYVSAWGGRFVTAVPALHTWG